MSKTKVDTAGIKVIEAVAGQPFGAETVQV
jgi:hypothetical protein